MEYSIQFATENDAVLIMEFIDRYWKKGHILAQDKDLFEWQYGGMDNQLNIVEGFDNEKEIQGMIGFIPYDVNELDINDIAIALWKANISTGFLGIKLLQFLVSSPIYRNIVCLGINLHTTSKIYTQFGMKIDTLQQWYRLRDLPDYKIAAIRSNTIPSDSGINAELVPYRTFDELLSNFDYDRYVTKEQVPYKSKAYFEKRYYRHPSYQYLVYGIRHDSEVRASIVLRIQECNGARVIRFVDCIGDYSQIAYATAGLDSLLEQFDAEYIDMYEAGLPDNMLAAAGWIKVKETDNIIPNYFSPFEQRVVDIHYCTSNPNIVLFRGDGDQDRPN